MNNIDLCNNAIKTALYKYGVVQYRNNNTPFAPSWEWNVMLWENNSWHCDCLGFVHCLVNGFNGNKSKLGGGAKMDSFVTNTDEQTTINDYCKDVSTNFNIITKGECLYMNGHVGLYIGDYVYNNKTFNVAECTMAFGGGAMLTYVNESGIRFNHKNGSVSGKWEKHGKFKRVTYGDSKKLKPTEILDVAKDVINGKYGNNPTRKEKLVKQYGEDTYRIIQDIINRIYK